MFSSLFVCWHYFSQKLPNGFAWNFAGRLAMGGWTNDSISLAVRIAVWIQGLFSGFVTNGRYGKWLTDINLLLHPVIHTDSPGRCMRQRLLRRALAEVCSVPVLLVFKRITHDSWNYVLSCESIPCQRSQLTPRSVFSYRRRLYMNAESQLATIGGRRTDIDRTWVSSTVFFFRIHKVKLYDSDRYITTS